MTPDVIRVIRVIPAILRSQYLSFCILQFRVCAPCVFPVDACDGGVGVSELRDRWHGRALPSVCSPSKTLWIENGMEAEKTKAPVHQFKLRVSGWSRRDESEIFGWSVVGVDCHTVARNCEAVSGIALCLVDVSAKIEEV